MYSVKFLIYNNIWKIYENLKNLNILPINLKNIVKIFEKLQLLVLNSVIIIILIKTIKIEFCIFHII